MSLPDQTPRLPKWIFLTADGALLALAWWIARSQPGHLLTGYPLLAVVICVALAGVLGVIPFLTDYAWSQDKALDERQRSLEALARTAETAAEQISIAAAGLHEIADLAQKNLKQADALPAKLQDKIAEFKVQTASTRSEEIEELEREITALRASENDKLEAASDKIAKAVVDFGKAESVLQKQIEKAGTALEKATKAQAETLATARDAAIAAIEGAVAKAVKAIATATPQKVDGAPEAAPKPPSLREEVRNAEPEPLPVSADTPAEPEPGAYVPEPPPIVITPQAEVAPVAPDTPIPFPVAEPEPAPVVMTAPAPEPEVIVAPVPEAVAEMLTPPPAAANEPEGEPNLDEPPVVKVPKKRAPKKVEEPLPSLALDEGSDFSQGDPEESAAPAETADTAISSDGATRLLVTAYIGIGNRLFLRGEGPGLTWEKGVPLQFVSIGKWRWETSDATSAVKFRLYKNDADECVGLGEKTIEPGHQLQLSASF